VADPESRWREFEELGERKVRQNLAAHVYGEDNTRLAREWLDHKEAERKRSAQAEQSEAADRASSAAERAADAATRAADAAAEQARQAQRANRIAATALLIAIAAAIMSLIALTKKIS